MVAAGDDRTTIGANQKEWEERMIGAGGTLKGMLRWPGLVRALVASSLTAGALSAPSLCERAAAADAYPSQSIRIVTPLAAGSASDVALRILPTSCRSASACR